MHTDPEKIKIVWDEEDNIYVATFPKFKGCIAHGESKQKAKSELLTLIKEWKEVQKERSEKSPISFK